MDGGSNSVSRWSQDYIVDHLSLYNVECESRFFLKKMGGNTYDARSLIHCCSMSPLGCHSGYPIQSTFRYKGKSGYDAWWVEFVSSIYSSSIYHKEISWGFSWEHENRYSLHPILNIILTSWEVKHTQLWYNIYKKILIFMVHI